MKIIYVLFTTVFITVCVQFSHQLGSGAPTNSCPTLLPNHRGNIPQSTQSPYVITVSERLGSGNFHIRINASDRSVSGFLIQGRRVLGDASVGGFITPSPPAQYQIMRCVTVADSATHTNPTMKSEVILEWTPPVGFRGQFYFTGTVLQDFATYWGGIRSPIITI